MSEFRDRFREDRAAVIHNDRDLWILWTGEPGDGKTWGALKLAEEENPDFCLDDVVFNTEDLAHRVKTAPPGSIIILDEAIRGAMGREHMTSRNRGLKVLSATGRFYNQVIIVINPEKNDLDKTVIERVKYWLHNVSRGKCLPHRGQKAIYKKRSSNRGFTKMRGFHIDAEAPRCWKEYEAKKHRESEAADREARGQYVPLDRDVETMSKKIVLVLQES